MRHERFSARGVRVSTTADTVSVDTIGSGVVVQLVPVEPGDEVAADRIRAARIEESGGTVRVSMPDRPGGGVSSGGTTIQARHVTGSIAQAFGRGVRAGRGSVVSYGDGNITIGGTHISGANSGVVIGGTHIVGGDLNLGAHSGRGRGRGGGMATVGGGAVRIIVSMPDDGPLTVDTVSGSVTQRGAVGATRITTTSGEVRLGLVGRLDIETVSGAVSVARAQSGGRVETVSGAVSVTSTGPTVSVETVSGSVSGSGTVEASAVSGSVRITR